MIRINPLQKVVPVSFRTCKSAFLNCIGLGVLIFLIPAPPVTATPAIIGPPVLFETDLVSQPSDQLALTQAMRIPGMNLVGVAVAPDNPALAPMFIHDLARLTGREDILIGNQEPTSGDRPWMSANLLPAQPVLSATTSVDLMISLSKKYPKELVILTTGPLTSLAKAMQVDPGFVSRIKGIFISQVNIEGKENRLLLQDIQSASQVFSSTIPITLIEDRLADDFVLGNGAWMRLAATHTSLTDYLLQHLSHAFPEQKPHIPIPACPAVAYLGQAVTGTLVTKTMAVNNGVFTEASPGKGRQFNLLTGIKPDDVRRNLEESLQDSNRDFTISFASLILSFKKLKRENISRIQDALQEGAPILEIPAGTDPEEGFRSQKLAYIDWYIRLFGSIEDPVAAQFTEQLKETFLRMAGIGLVPPDEIYRDWNFGYDSGQPILLHLGVSNQAGEALENLSVKATLGHQTASGSIPQTSEVISWLDLTINPDGQPNPLPELIVSLVFTCRGTSYQRTIQFPVKVNSPNRIEAIRPVSDALEVGFRIPAAVSLTALPADNSGSPITAMIHSVQSWSRVAIPAQEFGFGKGIRVSIGDSLASEPVYGLVEPATATFIPEPEGPSRSACFAVEREGRWGWCTDGLSGAPIIEYRVDTARLPDMATAALGITVDFYDEGDSLDTFRIEAAAETGEFIPVTPWLRKGDVKGWRKETFRISPAAENLFRDRSIRFLRVDSHKDGDEVIQGLAVHGM